MIKRVFVRVVNALSSPDSSATSAEERAAALHMATAVLMLEVARADHVFE